MNAEKALAIITEKGIYELGGYEGCGCTSFEVQGVKVDVACGKGSTGVESIFPEYRGYVVRVYSEHLVIDPPSLLSDIATQIFTEVMQEKPTPPSCIVRFCSWEADKKLLCTYCGGARDNPTEYHCAACRAL